jgi:hypothetical protein
MMRRHVSQPVLLAALKQALEDLETVKTVSPDEPGLVGLKEHHRQTIARLQRGKTNGSDEAAA